jgi:hypothetical protein
VDIGEILTVHADILKCCALGGIINVPAEHLGDTGKHCGEIAEQMLADT